MSSILVYFDTKIRFFIEIGKFMTIETDFQ